VSGAFPSPDAVAVDASGICTWRKGGANRVRQVMTMPLKAAFSKDAVQLKGSAVEAVKVVTNILESLPYQLKIATDDGGGWLKTNRVTGMTGDAISVSADGSKLPPGIYRGTLTVMLNAAVGSLRVTLVVDDLPH